MTKNLKNGHLCPLCKKGIIIFIEFHVDNKNWMGGGRIDIKLQSCTNEKCGAYTVPNEIREKQEKV